MSYTQFEIIENIGILTLNRYQKRNAINLEFMQELKDFLDKIALMPISALIVKSTGNVFCAGGDIDYFARLNTMQDAKKMVNTMHTVLNAFEDLEIPTVCCINGSAVGGGAEFILAFDVRFLANDCFIQFKEIQMGVTTGWGGTFRLVNTVGHAKALEFLLKARPIYPKEAYECGLINSYYDKEVLFVEALNFCKSFVNEDLRLIKAIKKIAKASKNSSRKEALDLETDIFCQTWMFGKRQKIMENFIKRKK